MSRKPILTEDMIDWAFEKRLDGYPFRDIARALNVGCATIFGALQKRGLVRKLPPLIYIPPEGGGGDAEAV